jgi:hypothetical protein
MHSLSLAARHGECLGWIGKVREYTNKDLGGRDSGVSKVYKRRMEEG